MQAQMCMWLLHLRRGFSGCGQQQQHLKDIEECQLLGLKQTCRAGTLEEGSHLHSSLPVNAAQTAIWKPRLYTIKPKLIRVVSRHLRSGPYLANRTHLSTACQVLAQSLLYTGWTLGLSHHSFWLCAWGPFTHICLIRPNGTERYSTFTSSLSVTLKGHYFLTSVPGWPFHTYVT